MVMGDVILVIEGAFAEYALSKNHRTSRQLRHEALAPGLALVATQVSFSRLSPLVDDAPRTAKHGSVFDVSNFA